MELFEPATLEDMLALEQIRQLVLRYNYLVDTGQGARLVELFTEDGVWDCTDNGHGYVAGHAAIAKFFGMPRGDTVTHHMTLPPVILEMSATEARGACTYTGQTRFNGGPQLALEAGRYNDHYVRTDQGWRFKARVLEHVFPSRRQVIEELGVSESLPDRDKRLS